MNILYILIASFLVMLMSLSGIIFTKQALHDWAERNLKYLTSFSTGVFLVVGYRLITEIRESHLILWEILTFGFIGIILALLLEKLIPGSHHHHGTGETPHKHSKAGAQRIMLSDTIHNFTDGFLIVPAFLIDVRLGIVTTLGIAIHEIAQEISEFFVLKSAGYSNKRALSINFLSASSIIIGSLVSYSVAASAEQAIAILLAIAGGIIVFTIFRDLIPHSFHSARVDKTYHWHLAMIIFGIFLIVGVNTIFGEEHDHSGTNHESETHHSQDVDRDEAHNDNHDDDHDQENIDLSIPTPN
ncbi:MAG: ZIP family metal transporter [Candidatus Doudnabacteria bacterium]